MVMRAPVWGAALDEICTAESLLVVPTPAGRLFSQATAQRWSTEQHLVFACGRYEGIDQRVADDAARRMRVEEVSIGDYVLNGGESAALVMIEAVVRLLPEVIGNPASHQQDSHSDGLLEGPSYTRPASWRGSTCRRCCSRATTRRSRRGGGNSRWSAPGSADRTCSVRSGPRGTSS